METSITSQKKEGIPSDESWRRLFFPAPLPALLLTRFYRVVILHTTLLLDCIAQSQFNQRINQEEQDFSFQHEALSLIVNVNASNNAGSASVLFFAIWK